ncbi:MAG: response regulator [Candidatus Omnitrophica bacterium]|nr:response regulator [Candidatus Omnitrophota bacterium]
MLKSVLLADSDSESGEKLRKIMCSIGHQTECIACSEDIFQRLHAEKPDLFVLEQNSFSEESYEVLKKIREIEKEIKILLLVKESPSDETRARVQRLGVSDVVKKDFFSHTMFKAILQIVREPTEKVEENKYSYLGKILLVDDRSEVRASSKTFLKFRGFDVSDAADGNQALTLMKQEKPKLILLDVRMPEMDGLTVLNKIKEFDKAIQVVMLSGLDEEDVIREAFKMGACDFLVKPFDFRTLEAVVLSILVSAQCSAA